MPLIPPVLDDEELVDYETSSEHSNMKINIVHFSNNCIVITHQQNWWHSEEVIKKRGDEFHHEENRCIMFPTYMEIEWNFIEIISFHPHALETNWMSTECFIPQPKATFKCYDKPLYIFLVCFTHDFIPFYMSWYLENSKIKTDHQ